MSRENELAELVRANDSILKLTGKRPRGYRSPAWDLSPNTLDLLLSEGFAYDSSMMGHDYLPYYVRHDQADKIGNLLSPAEFGPNSRLLEMPISWSLDDYPHFEGFALQPASGVLENWTADFDYMQDTAEFGVLTYTFHPFVSGRGHRMRIMEQLIEHCKAKGAQFMAMEMAAEAARARHASAGDGIAAHISEQQGLPQSRM